MGISESLSGIYSKIEDSFYGFLDFLEQKGLPVYSVVNPLEERGVPFFPVFVLAIIILAVLAFGFVSTVATPITAKLSLKDTTEAALIDVGVIAKDQSGRVIDLGSSAFRDGASVDLPGIGVGQKITFSATKEGYKALSSDIVAIRLGSNDVALVLQKETSAIVGKLRLVEEETGAPVRGATVVASLSDASSISCDEESEGVYACIGVEEGQNVNVQVRSGSYEDAEFGMQFRDGGVTDQELVLKASAAAGISNLVVTVIDEAGGQRIEGASIRVFDSQTNQLITEVVDDDGVYIEKISKGTSIRVVVSKDGYQQYDSGAVNFVKALREDEEQFPVFMKTGGASISVRVKDESLPLSGATVSLYNKNNQLVQSQETYFAGEISFSNLDANETYYVTASMQTFLPLRKEIVPSRDKVVDLVLQRANEGNSEVIEIFVSEKQKPVNNANLDFFEIADEKEFPLGIAQQKTDLSGKISINLPSGREILVKATTAELEGENSVEVREGGSRQLLIEMSKIKGIVLLRLVDLQGGPVTEGHLRVESKGGEVIFDGTPDENGSAYFDSEGNDYVVVKFVDALGKTFEEEVYVKGKEELQIKVGVGEVTGLTPTIVFDGVFDVGGEKVDGVRIGQEYFLKFSVEFPEGEGKHGVHVRAGDDSVRFADSQDVGILGFAASNAQSFLGRSYSPSPNPGFEGIDYQNRGKAGSYNKFVELYFADGGKKVVKVRVKAKETAEASGFAVHYRAWSEFGASTYRAPSDDSLQLEAYSDEKTGLYAETSNEEISIFKTTSSCKEKLCASYNFVRRDGSVYSVADFKPVSNEMYALEIEYSATSQTGLSIKASTSKADPKLYFQGYEIENFANFNDYNKADTDIEVKSLTVGQEETRKARLYFKTASTGTTSISLQSITQDDTITETFYFDVFLERNLVVKTQPGTIKLGEDFSFVVEAEDGSKVENAAIKLKRKDGELLLGIAGNATRNNGLNGVYRVKNAFDPGAVVYEVSADGFKPLSGELDITKTGVLNIEPEIRIAIAKGQQAGTATTLLENLSNESVDEVVVEINKKGSFPVGMELKADTVVGIPANTGQNISFTADYRGKAERAHGEAEVTIKGKVLGKYSVSTTAKVIIDYNPLLSEGDIEFSKDRLVLYLESGFEQRGFYDQQYLDYYPNAESNIYDPVNSGTTDTLPYRYTQYSSAKTVEFKIKNNSNIDLTLVPEVVSASPNETEGIKVELNEVRLKPAGTEESGRRLDQQDVRVSVTNTLLRNYPNRSTFKFDIFFKSDAVTKSIPLEIIIWHPRYALEVSRNIELYLATSNPAEPARATVPLFLRNVGLADIENISIDVSSASTRGNVDVKVLDSLGRGGTQIQLLQKGQAVLPPLVLVAESFRTEKSTLVDVKQIQVMGTIDGKVYQFGPIVVTSHISAAECLSVVPNNMEFQTEKEEGSRSQKMQVKNTCAEPVRILAFEKSEFGGNRLFLDRPDTIIPAGTSQELNVILAVNERIAHQDSVFLKGLLVNSGRFISSNPINLDIRIGKEAVKTGEATQQVQLNVCNDNGEIIKDRKGQLYAIPKQALNNNCEIAYCDAEQLAEFLATKIDEKVKEAQRQITLYNQDARTAGCDSTLRGNYCSFEGLGLTRQTYNVYFKHDNLTAAALEAAIRKKPSVGSYSVAYEPSSKDVGLGIGLIGKKVVMNDTIAGCGRYRVSVSGAVKTQGTKIISDFMNVLVDLHSGEVAGETLAREITEQCLPKIQNIMNFLPEDKSFTTDTAGTWLGMVDQGQEGYEEIGKEVAKGLFGSEQRFREGGAAGTNRLHLGKGTTGGYIVKLDIEKKDDEGPRTINAYVQDVGGTEQLQKQNAKEASQAINSLKAGAFEGACISETEGELFIKPATGRGDITISMCVDESTQQAGKLSVAIGRTTCCDFNVLNILPGTALVSHVEKKELGGVSNISIIGNQTAVTSTKLSEKDPRTNQYISKLQLCVTGTETAHTAHNEQIELNAKYDVESKPAVPKTVSLQVCGTHPTELIKEISKTQPTGEKPAVLFATMVWKGNPESVTLNDLKKFERSIDLSKPFEGSDFAKQLAVRDKMQKQKRNAIFLWYLPACSVASAASGAIVKMGFWGAIISPVFDCLIPSIVSYATDIGVPAPIEGAINWVSDNWGKVVSFVKSVIFGEEPNTAVIEEAVNEIQKSSVPGSTLTQIQQDAADIGLTAFAAGTAHSLAYGESQAFGTVVSERNAESAARQVASRIAERARQTTLSGADDAMIEALEDDLTGKITEKLMKYRGTDLKYTDFASGKEGDTVIESATKSAVAEFETGLNPVLQTQIDAIRADPAKRTALSTNTQDALKKAEDAVKAEGKKKFDEAASGIRDDIGGTVGNRPIDVDRTTGAITPAGEKSIDDLAKSISDNVKSELDNRGIELTSAEKSQVTRTIKSQLKARGSSAATPTAIGKRPVYTAALNSDDAKGAIQAALSKVKSKFVGRFVDEEADTIAKNLAKQVTAEVDSAFTDKTISSKVRWTKLKGIVRSVFTKTFWKNLGKGVLTGTIGNAIGLAAYNAYYKWVADPITPEAATVAKKPTVETLPDGTTVMKYAEDEDISFRKYDIVKVEFVNEYGYVRHKITVSNAQELKEKLANKEAKLIDRCDGKFSSVSFPALLPDPNDLRDVFSRQGDAEKVGKFIAPYYENHGVLIKDIAARYPSVNDALLATIWTWRSASDKPATTGCGGNLDPVKSFDCAAATLQQLSANYGAVEQGSDLEEYPNLERLLTTYNEKYPVKAGESLSKSEMEFLVNTYRFWNLNQWETAEVPETVALASSSTAQPTTETQTPPATPPTSQPPAEPQPPESPPAQPAPNPEAPVGAAS